MSDPRQWCAVCDTLSAVVVDVQIADDKGAAFETVCTSCDETVAENAAADSDRCGICQRVPPNRRREAGYSRPGDTTDESVSAVLCDTCWSRIRTPGVPAGNGGEK